MANGQTDINPVFQCLIVRAFKGECHPGVCADFIYDEDNRRADFTAWRHLAFSTNKLVTNVVGRIDHALSGGFG